LREVHDVPVLVGNPIKKMMRDDHTGTRTFSPVISTICNFHSFLPEISPFLTG
jgi:hypothetical protein